MPVWRVKYDKEHTYKGEFSFELSVVRIGTHGDHSWGWESDDKIMLLRGDNDRYSRKTISMVRIIADQLCKKLN